MPKKGTAMLVGNLGSSPVHFWLDDEKLMLLQITETGNMTLTSMNSPKNGKPVGAAHSRHMWIMGQALISQWAGTCKLR
jgi:hypothetical protein